MTHAAILWPIRFASTAYVLRLAHTIIGTTYEDITFPATGSLTAGRNYWLSGDGQADADGGVGGVGDLLTMLEDAIGAASMFSALTITVALSSWRVTVTAGGGVFAGTYQLLWSHANTTLDPTIFGFTSADTSASTGSTTGPNMPSGIFRPQRALSQDTRDRQPIVASVGRAISGLQRTARLALPAKERDFAFPLLPAVKALEEYAATTEPSNTFETMWIEALSYGRPFRLYEDESTLATSSSYTLYKPRDLEDPLTIRTPDLAYWDARLKAVKV